jgi:hypothetical protein
LPAAWITRVRAIAADSAATGKTIFLSLGPLAGRRTLSAQADSSGNPVNGWVPVDAAGCYAFGSVANAEGFARAYAYYAKYMVDLFKPDYLGLVVEMNVEFTHCPSQKEGFKQWYAGVYRDVKRAYPALPMFATFQFEHLYGMADAAGWCGGVKTDAALGACFQRHLEEALALPGDRIAFSMYPANFKYPPSAPDSFTPEVPYADAFRRVRQTTPKKIWTSETGWGAVEILTTYQHATPASVCGTSFMPVPFINGEANMREHLRQLLEQAQLHEFEGVVWWANRDIMDATTASTCPCVGSNFTCDTTDQLYQSVGGAAGSALELAWRAFGNMGLRQKDGTPRQTVYDEWQTHFAQPYSAAQSLAQIQIYPNPLRPTRGHAGINFTNLPEKARVRIYTLAGEFVRSLNATLTGLATWDGKNDAGQKAASGVYHVLIEGAGERQKLKVAVQR